VAFEALAKGVPLDDAVGIQAMTAELLARHGPSGLFDSALYDPAALRAPEVNRAVSVVSTVGAVREIVTATVRSWSVDVGRCIVEGRDIGTTVFPGATVKFYLTATAEERATRRCAQERQGSYEDVLADVRRRDSADMTRSMSPLRPADDSVVIDTTGTSLIAVVASMAQTCRNAGLSPAR
jgi:cytidylate kinase